MTDERGFTLIESLIAFAILSVTLLAIYDSLTTATRGLDRVSMHEQAVLLAQSQLDRLVASKTLPQEQAGTIDASPFRWRMTVEPRVQRLNTLRANLEPRRIKLTIEWQSGIALRSVAIERIILVKRTEGAP